MSALVWTTPVVECKPATKPEAKAEKRIIGFWHIGAIGDWRRIIPEQYSKLRDFGLYDASEKIVVGFIGGRCRQQELNIPILDDPKFEVFATENVEDYEFPTLARLWQAAHESEESFLCYYVHTKGASLVATPQQQGANAWRLYMEYFTIEKWQDCAAILGEYETCGVELQLDDSHYSGNFWWATSDYIKKLPDAHRYWADHKNDRLAAEFYVCLAHPKAHCFNDFEENLYDFAIPRERYAK